MKLASLPVEAIAVRDGWNPRTVIDPDTQTELEHSITQHGIMQPLVVDEAADGAPHHLVEGHRRLAAAKALGLEQVPVIIQPAGLTEAVVLNMRRDQLPPIDEANAYQRLKADGHTITDIANLVGVPVARVAERLDLLQLPPDLQDHVNHRTLPLAAAGVLVRIAVASPDLAAACAQQVIDGHHTATDLSDDLRGVIWQVRRGKGAPFAMAAPSHQMVSQLRDYFTGADLDELTVAAGDFHVLELTVDDADAARAYGCLVDNPAYDANDRYASAGWITDPVFARDRLKLAIDRKVAERAKFDAEHADRVEAAATRGDEDPDAAARRAAEEEARAEARASARRQNLQLGAHLYQALHNGVLDDDLERDITLLVCHTLTATVAWGISGVGNAFEHLQDADGHVNRDQACQFITAQIDAAPTPGAIVARTAEYLLAGWLTDSLNTWQPGPAIGAELHDLDLQALAPLAARIVTAIAPAGTLKDQALTQLAELDQDDADAAGDEDDSAGGEDAGE